MNVAEHDSVVCVQVLRTSKLTVSPQTVVEKTMFFEAQNTKTNKVLINIKIEISHTGKPAVNLPSLVS